MDIFLVQLLGFQERERKGESALFSCWVSRREREKEKVHCSVVGFPGEREKRRKCIVQLLGFQERERKGESASSFNLSNSADLFFFFLIKKSQRCVFSDGTTSAERRQQSLNIVLSAKQEER